MQVDNRVTFPFRAHRPRPTKMMSPYELEGKESEWVQRLSYASGTEQGGCRIAFWRLRARISAGTSNTLIQTFHPFLCLKKRQR